MAELTWYEFFAGGGMARLGLGSRWRCLFANDSSASKAVAYRSYFGKCPELEVRGVESLHPEDVPGRADLAWASFPCQDLSLAGMGEGLRGKRSGTFWPFWELMQGIIADNRRPRTLVIENVVGTLTSHGGKDFLAILRAVNRGGYRAGALVVDAVRFLPQSRPRLFLIAVDEGLSLASLMAEGPSREFHPRTLRAACSALPRTLAERWVWWNLPVPTNRQKDLEGLLEEHPQGVDWHPRAHTLKLLSMMSEANREKVRIASRAGRLCVGTVYRRTRPDPQGRKVQRAEVRFDGVAGCLRTPAGGSSRQTVLIVDGRNTRSRLLSPREAARLMGVPDRYPIPANYNEAYHLFGDGLAVPVVAWLERHLLRPLALANKFEVAA